MNGKVKSWIFNCGKFKFMINQFDKLKFNGQNESDKPKNRSSRVMNRYNNWLSLPAAGDFFGMFGR